MAAPIIDSITAPSEVQAGTSFQVQVVAHDPDAGILTLTGIARDAANNPSSQQLVTVNIQDPLTFELTADNPAVTITQVSPGVFDVVLPAA